MYESANKVNGHTTPGAWIYWLGLCVHYSTAQGRANNRMLSGIQRSSRRCRRVVPAVRVGRKYKFSAKKNKLCRRDADRHATGIFCRSNNRAGFSSSAIGMRSATSAGRHMPEKPKVVESIINIIVICEKNMYYFRQMCYITREAVGGVFGQV